MMTYAIWPIYLPLQTEGCILNCVPYRKLSTTWLASHLILLYLRLLGHIPAHLLLCTSPLHILIVFFSALLYLMLYPTGTHFLSQLFQVPLLQLLKHSLTMQYALSNFNLISIEYSVSGIAFLNFEVASSVIVRCHCLLTGKGWVFEHA